MDATTASAHGAAAAIITPPELLEHWQGHRRLTRRVIEAFPEDKLFTCSIGGMRPFSAFVLDFLGMAVPIARGLATGTWGAWGDDANPPTTRADLLGRWDQATDDPNRVWTSDRSAIAHHP